MVLGSFLCCYCYFGVVLIVDFGWLIGVVFVFLVVFGFVVKFGIFVVGVYVMLGVVCMLIVFYMYNKKMVGCIES